MIDPTFPWHRFAAIVGLAERVPTGLQHTALVKYAYFLQVLLGVPLGYRFTLYAYGPFDAAVLDDMDYAHALEAVDVRAVDYSKGYHYDISPGRSAKEVKAKAPEFLAAHESAFDWVIREFDGLSAAQLEAVSTMIFADREAWRSGERLTLEELTHRVLEVKPRFSRSDAQSQAESLHERGLLRAIRS